MLRRLLAVASCIIAVMVLGTPARADETAGLVPLDAWQARQADYLDFVTSGPFDPGSALSLLAFAQRARTDPSLIDEVASAKPDDLEHVFAKLRAFTDTGDFDVNEFLPLLAEYRDLLDPTLATAIEERVLAFKYWWTEPTPDDVIDSQYYWTENHLIIFLANEYIAGQMYPDKVFTNSGMTGAEHMAHAATRIRRWIELRARFGFSEWLSNVYWNEDLKGALLLAEQAEDPEIARLASMVLDMMFVELASHLQEGTFGATHGRSYQKDKLNARDEDTFNLAKMAFDDVQAPYTGADTAVLLAIVQKYRPPEVARRIAATDEVATVRQHQSLPLDPLTQPYAGAVAPYGLTYSGEDALMTWWSMGGQFPWQMAPESAHFVDEHDLFKSSNFRQVAVLEPLVGILSDDAIRGLSRFLAPLVNPGLLSSVDTSTWRAPEVMLSAAQDWRPGQRSEQVHMWQATLDQDASVFTNHPRTGVPSAAAPNEREGYWTGEAAVPRTVHKGRSLISVYTPAYPSLSANAGSGGSGGYGLGYAMQTHAFFPTEHFDEVVERDGWVIARKGDGYVALWSWRPAKWRTYNPATEFTRGLTQRFDLVADGGPDNVWITEVGRAADHPGAPDPFGAFVDAVTATKPVVRPYAFGQPCPSWAPLATLFCLHLPFDGFDVMYRSPSEGTLTFGWRPTSSNPKPPFKADGATVDLHPDDQARWDSPWASAAWDSQRYHASLDGWSLDLDFAAATRETAAP